MSGGAGAQAQTPILGHRRLVSSPRAAAVWVLLCCDTGCTLWRRLAIISCTLSPKQEQ